MKSDRTRELKRKTGHEHDYEDGLDIRAIIAIAFALLLGSTSGPATDNVRVSGGGITPLHSIIWVAQS